MVIKSIIGATSAWILFIMGTPAAASVIYNYTGNVYDAFSATTSYTADMSVSGTVEIDAPLPNGAMTNVTPINFSFFDGIKTIDTANATSASFVFTVDGNGEIVDWVMNVRDINTGITWAEIHSFGPISWLGLAYDTADYACVDVLLCPERPVNFEAGQAFSNAGQWSIISSVPIPSAVWLFGSGLIGLIGFARRKLN